MSNQKKNGLVILHSIKSADLKDTNLENCRLNILMGENRFAYCIINKKNVVSSLNDYAISASNNKNYIALLAKCVDQHNLLGKHFRKVNIGIQTANHCMLSNSLVKDESLIEQYYTVVPPPSKKKQVFLKTSIDNSGYFLAYNLRKKTFDFLTKNWANAQIKHAFGSFLNSILHDNDSTSPKKMYVNLYRGFVDICVTHYGKLKYTNTFAYANSAELLYNLLNAGKLNFFDFEKGAVYLSGFDTEDNAYLNLLSDYIHHLHLLSTPSHIETCVELFGMPNHQYYNLYCL